MVAKESLFLLHHYPTSPFLNLVPLMLQEPQTQCPADTVAEMKSGFHNNRPWLTLGQSESTSTSHPNSIWGFVFCSFIALFHCTPTLGLAVFPRCSGGQSSHATQSRKTHSRLQHFGVPFSLLPGNCLFMPKRWGFFLHILLTLLLTSNAKLGIQQHSVLQRPEGSSKPKV